MPAHSHIWYIMTQPVKVKSGHEHEHRKTQKAKSKCFWGVGGCELVWLLRAVLHLQQRPKVFLTIGSMGVDTKLSSDNGTTTTERLMWAVFQQRPKVFLTMGNVGVDTKLSPDDGTTPTERSCPPLYIVDLQTLLVFTLVKGIRCSIPR